MIYGVGIDIIEIERFEHNLLKQRFHSKVYGQQELEYLLLKNKSESFAASFCAKEAFAKALGTGIKGFKLSEVQVLRNDIGKPYYKLDGAALLLTQQANITFSLSISHSKHYATAVAIAEIL
jgi:holo-[acyl-carrier protein] synthase